MLRGYSPHDLEEERHLRRIHALLERGPEAFRRDHFRPGHFTASAFVLDPTETRLLLVHHAKLHRWLQPGGHVEATDANVVAAARREIEEEVDLRDLRLLVDGVFDVDVHAIPPLKADPGHEHFDLRFLFRSTTVDAVAGSDARDARWFPFGEVSAAESDRSVLRALHKLLDR
jgi:8-oxo-dGTP pyrophosphatase MutT (NUDIX family)